MRLLRRVIGCLVFLSLVLLLGGGSYYASEINADGLAVSPDVNVRTLVVERVSSTSITLSERNPQEQLRRTGVYGVEWATGYGQLRGSAAVQGKLVTRPFALLSGRLPGKGDAVAITRDAFPADPAVQTISYTSEAGTFPAWYVPGRSSTWAVLVHGKGASRTQMLRVMRTTTGLGLPSMNIAYRNDAGVPRDPEGRYAYGKTEWKDLDAAVAEAQRRGAKRVVLAGHSMGGAIVAAFLQHSTRATLVSGVVLDSPLMSFSRTVEFGASQRSVPGTGIGLPAPLTWTAQRITSVLYGVDWDELDYLRDTSWVRVPTLVIHGTGDETVPVSTSKELAGRSTLVTLEVTKAAHVESWNADPARYDALVRTFVESRSR